MNVFIVAMENYVFLERGRSHLSKDLLFTMGTMKTFMWLYSGFPLFSQYVVRNHISTITIMKKRAATKIQIKRNPILEMSHLKKVKYAIIVFTILQMLTKMV